MVPGVPGEAGVLDVGKGLRHREGELGEALRLVDDHDHLGDLEEVHDFFSRFSGKRKGFELLTAGVEPAWP